MMKRIVAALFTVFLLTGTIAPCFVSASGITENSAAAETAIESTADADTGSTDAQDSTEAAQEEKKSETSSGIPAPVNKASGVSDGEPSFTEKIAKNFHNTFIRDNRWQLFLEGFGNTIFIALCSTLLGVFIGMAVALVKVFKAQIDKPNIFVRILNGICNLYTTVIRGTPAVVQLFIAYYIIFKSTDNYILVSIFAFGVNSGAYVSEIIRAGILSIDRGQLEAGRSLGLSHIQTMFFIILPQAIKNILPSLGNEFILLLKDTSIAGYIGTLELMKAGNIVRSRTFEPYFSLLSVAGIYLIVVIGMEQILKYFERRLAKSDRR